MIDEAVKSVGKEQKKDNSNISGFGGGNLSKNSSTKNNIQEEFSSGESEQSITEQSEGGASAPSEAKRRLEVPLGCFSSPNSFDTFATKSTENGA